MIFHKSYPVESFQNLKERVERFFKISKRRSRGRNQLLLDLPALSAPEEAVKTPRDNITEFLGFLCDALPGGDIYLFGGLLRDLALLGRKGFSSDIDVVVEGDWIHCTRYLESIGARKNKFGGYRVEVDGWPVDIWNARETWAIKQGLVQYLGIASLTETTVLNWDAILMNWRTRQFIYRDGYLDALRMRLLDIVLEKNPNPLGMAVRVFRHLSIKDARKVTPVAAEYLANCTSQFAFDDIVASEIRSYGNSAIDAATYVFFEELKKNEFLEIRTRFKATSDNLKRRGISLTFRQSKWNFDESNDGH